MGEKVHSFNTNIAPTNGWLEYNSPIGEAYFRGRTVSFRECNTVDGSEILLTSWYGRYISHYLQGFIYVRWLFGISKPSTGRVTTDPYFLQFWPISTCTARSMLLQHSNAAQSRRRNLIGNFGVFVVVMNKFSCRVNQPKNRVNPTKKQSKPTKKQGEPTKKQGKPTKKQGKPTKNDDFSVYTTSEIGRFFAVYLRKKRSRWQRHRVFFKKKMAST